VTACFAEFLLRVTKDRDLRFARFATVQTPALPKKFRYYKRLFWEIPRESLITAQREVKAMVHANPRSGS
jgi:hypothetical protein